jgi:predicted nuclease of restriction endonuclease-like (RecB) superfamily
VRDAIKDPYNFEFLGLSQEAKERDLELALLNDVQSFLVEMGRGFALVGRQFPLRILDDETGAEQEFFIDLLFYNYILRRFVVIDLKIEDFKPGARAALIVGAAVCAAVAVTLAPLNRRRAHAHPLHLLRR